MSDELKPVIEALIFASPDPLTPKMLFKLLESEPKEDVEAALEALKRDYERPGGLQLVEVAGGYQIVTKPELHEWVRRLFHERTTQRLSVQALETLAVIAYKQPITAPEITEIRGVNTAGVINTLIERQLVKIVGRKQVVGRPFMYATTREFLTARSLGPPEDRRDGRSAGLRRARRSDADSAAAGAAGSARRRRRYRRDRHDVDGRRAWREDSLDTVPRLTAKARRRNGKRS
jgi:segregation and condensation protein B